MVAGRPVTLRTGFSVARSADGRSRRGVPAARLAHLAGERPAQLGGDESGRVEDAAKAHAMVEAQAVEEVDEVLGGEIAGCARRIGTAAGSTGRRVKAANAGVEPGGDVGHGRPARVVEVEGDA